MARLRLALIVRFGVCIQVRERRVDTIMLGSRLGSQAEVFGMYLNEGLQPFTEGTLEISNVREDTILIVSPSRKKPYSTGFI
jgi:hypothetical protein